MISEKFSRTVIHVVPEYNLPPMDNEMPISSEYEVTELGRLTNSLAKASENPSPDYNQIEAIIEDMVGILRSTPPENPDGVIRLIQSACDKCGHTSPAFMDFLQRHDQQA